MYFLPRKFHFTPALTQHAATAALALLLGACATVPAPLQGQFAAGDAARCRRRQRPRRNRALGRRDHQRRPATGPDLLRDPGARARLDRAAGFARSERRSFSRLPQRVLRSRRIQAGPRHDDRRPAQRQRAGQGRRVRLHVSARRGRHGLSVAQARSTSNYPYSYYDPWGMWGYGAVLGTVLGRILGRSDHHRAAPAPAVEARRAFSPAASASGGRRADAGADGIPSARRRDCS